MSTCRLIVPLLCVCVLGETHLQRALAQASTVDQIFPLGVQPGKTATIKANGKHDGQQISWWSNTSGLSFEAGEKPGEVKVTAAADARPGVVLIRAIDGGGASRPLPFVIGLVSEFAETEPNNKWAEATHFPEAVTAGMGAVANGVISKRGDVDHFAVRLEAGQTLVAALDANSVFDSPMDALLQVLAPTGYVLEQNHDDRGLDPLIAFTAPEAGQYTIRLMAYPSTPDTSIGLSGAPTYQYRLLLTTGPVISHRLPLARGAEKRSATWFGWNIPAGQEVISIGPATEADALPGIPSMAHFQRYPAEAGLTRVVTEGDEQAGQVIDALPCVASGTIQTPGENDEFRFQAPKGTSLRIRVLAREFDSYLDPVLQVVDAAGKVIKETDDENRKEWDVDTTLSAPEGVFGLKVFDRFDKAGVRFFYHVDVRPDAPDFTLSTTTPGKAFKPGEKAEIKVAITRRGTINPPILISAEGLPAGVTATPVKSESKGDTSKEVTFVIEAAADAMPVGVPIRIVGQVEGEPALTRKMTLPRYGVIEDFTEFWLTIAPK